MKVVVKYKCVEILFFYEIVLLIFDFVKDVLVYMEFYKCVLLICE